MNSNLLDSISLSIERLSRTPEAGDSRTLDVSFPASVPALPLAGVRVLAAVSGGADSVALLCILHRLAPRFGFSLFAVTIDHRIRSETESGGDAAFVASLCASLEPPVPCTVSALDDGAVAREASLRGRGIEEAARGLRYREITAEADRLGACWIMTGHNRNDNLETILMRVLQGSGGAATGGIVPRRGRFVRPLLDVSRDDLTAWLRSQGISWREDATNGDDAYLRNRIRHHVVPALDAAVPGWDTGLLSFAEKARADDDFCRLSLRMEWNREGNGISCPADGFSSLHPALALRFLRDGLAILGLDHRVPNGYLERIIRETRAGTDCPVPPTAGLIAGSGLRFVRNGDSFFWGPDIVQNNKSGYLVYITDCGTYSVPCGSVTVSRRQGQYWLDDRYGPFSLPLTIRSRVSGDTVPTADGRRKTLKKLMNDWSVPERDRGLVPLVENGGEIRAVCGSFLGYPDWFVRV